MVFLWYLIPPSEFIFGNETSGLTINSNLHPSSRQVAQNIKFDKFYQGKYYKVTVHEGQTLYLPPFWLHRVVSSNDTSIALNV